MLGMMKVSQQKSLFKHFLFLLINFTYKPLNHPVENERANTPWWMRCPKREDQLLIYFHRIEAVVDVDELLPFVAINKENLARYEGSDRIRLPVGKRL